jgi:hypothetical protein
MSNFVGSFEEEEEEDDLQSVLEMSRFEHEEQK